MFIVEARDVEVYVKDRLLFRLAEPLLIKRGERIGIVGVNGAGKSTLLRVLTGRLAPEAGTVKRTGSMAYLDQMETEEEGADRRSGGERMIERIRQTLSRNADLLLADEPTSHLDIDRIRTVENALRGYDGTVVIVSHDRTLLDAVCGRIIEVEDGKIGFFTGNYTAYCEQKDAKVRRQQFEYEQYEKEKERLRRAAIEKAEAARSMKKKPSRMSDKESRIAREISRSRKAKVESAVPAIETRIAKLEKKERPKLPAEVLFDIRCHAQIAAKTVIRLDQAEKRFGGRLLFRDLSCRITPGMKLALVGPNGAGKTTLLSMIAAQEKGVVVTPSAKLSLFEQMPDHMPAEETILRYVMAESAYPEQTVRTMLARLLFRREDVFKRIGALSGGERVKAALARLFLSDCNVLLLDEPTNYLDIRTRERLEGVLADYPGTVLLATHDRTLINRVATHVLVFEGDRCIFAEGNLDDWEEEKARKAARAAEEEAFSAQVPGVGSEAVPAYAERMEKKLALDNELAEVIGRLSLAPKPAEKAELEERYARLLAELRSLQR